MPPPVSVEKRTNVSDAPVSSSSPEPLPSIVHVDPAPPVGATSVSWSGPDTRFGMPVKVKVPPVVTRVTPPLESSVQVDPPGEPVMVSSSVPEPVNEWTPVTVTSSTTKPVEGSSVPSGSCVPLGISVQSAPVAGPVSVSLRPDPSSRSKPMNVNAGDPPLGATLPRFSPVMIQSAVLP